MTEDFRRQHIPQKRGKGEAPRAKPAKNRKTRAKMAGKRTPVRKGGAAADSRSHVPRR